LKELQLEIKVIRKKEAWLRKILKWVHLITTDS